jgi:hypothetical protein
MADNISPSSADVTKSGSLNLPGPSVMGLLYLTQVWYSIKIKYNNANNISTTVTMLYNTSHQIHNEFDLDITI